MPTTARIIEDSGRPNQRRRTRKDLLQAAAQLLKQGRKPTLEEVAAEALVSRATAYRYFPSIEALHVEAALDVAVPDPEQLFASDSSDDPIERVQKADMALHDMIVGNEMSLRMMLVNSLQRGLKGTTDGEIPARQNRRTPLIEAALKPARKQFTTANYDLLIKALALVVGTEAMVVFKDVLRLDDAEARKVKRWTVAALIRSARKNQDKP